MNDDELSERLSRMLHAKAKQVQADATPFDENLSLLDPVETSVERRGWAVVLAAAAVLALIAAGVVLVVSRRDNAPVMTGPAAMSSTTTTTTTPTTTTAATTPRLADLPRRTLAGWSDVPDAAPDGSVAFDRFDRLLDEQHPEWADDSLVVALTFTNFQADVGREAGTLTGEQSFSGVDASTVTLTHTGLGDDSIAAERYAIAMQRDGDGSWRLVSVDWTQRCQPGRGHQEFNTEFCV